MLGSAWDWLVGLLATSQDSGRPFSKGDRRLRACSGGATWTAGWDEGDETAMVERILAERDGVFLDTLMIQSHAAPDSAHGQTPEMTPQATDCSRRNFWNESSRAEQACDAELASASSSWQSMGFVTAADMHAPPEAPLPALLDIDRTPSQLGSKGAKSALNHVVSQTSREDDVAGIPWLEADADSRTAEASTPVSVFDGFSPCGKDSLLPPQTPEDAGKRTLVLDLDETLVHSVFQPEPAADFTLTVQLNQGPLDVYVLKRPGVDKFLQAMAVHYEVVIFTASVREYAEPLLDILDPEGLVSHRLFRDACTMSRIGYVKDLTRLGRDIADVIIVDNSPHAYAFQPDNALPILSYYEGALDCELQKISPFLESLGGMPGDLRQLLTAALGAKVKSLMQTRLSFLL